MPKQANIKSCVEKRRNRREHRRYLCHDKEKPAGNSLHIGERSDLNPQVDLFRKRWRSGKRIRAVAKPRNFLHGRGKARKRCPNRQILKAVLRNGGIVANTDDICVTTRRKSTYSEKKVFGQKNKSHGETAEFFARARKSPQAVPHIANQSKAVLRNGGIVANTDDICVTARKSPQAIVYILARDLTKLWRK